MISELVGASVAISIRSLAAPDGVALNTNTTAKIKHCCNSIRILITSVCCQSQLQDSRESELRCKTIFGKLKQDTDQARELHDRDSLPEFVSSYRTRPAVMQAADKQFKHDANPN